MFKYINSYYAQAILIFVIAVAQSLLFTAPIPVIAQEQLNWSSRERATGNWNGVRTSLTNSGIDLELNYTTDILANPTGEFNQTAAYADLWGGSINLDLEKIFGWKNAIFFVGHVYSGGEDLSQEAIGNLFGVAETYSGQGWRLTRVQLTQRFFDDRFELALGRLSSAVYFVKSPLGGYYVNAALNGNPNAAAFNINSLFTSTRAQWGIRATVNMTSDFALAGGVYYADPEVGDQDKHGFDFSLDPEKGFLFISQITWKPTLHFNMSELPGAYRLGAFVDTSAHEEVDPTLSNPSEIKGNWGIYGILEQMVYQEKEDEGLTLWGSFLVSPQWSINTLSFSAYLGTYYKGLLDLRPNDITAAVVGAGFFSPDLPGQTSEWFIEVNHRFQFTPWYYLTSDFQYIINPSGRSGLSNAVVVGAELSINF